MAIGAVIRQLVRRRTKVVALRVVIALGAMAIVAMAITAMAINAGYVFDYDYQEGDQKTKLSLSLPSNQMSPIASSNNEQETLSSVGDINITKEESKANIKEKPEAAIADFDIVFNRGNSHIELGNYQAAIEDYTETIKLDPNDAATYNNRGHSQAELGNYQIAIEDYTKAIKLDPNYTEAYNNRGYSQDELGNHPAAIEDYTKAIKLDPNDAAAYNKAIELDPQYFRAYSNLMITKFLSFGNDMLQEISI